MWAPDGDAAFDDGSRILHFDINGKVRLISFKCCGNECMHEFSDLVDAWLKPDEFYGILQGWHTAFIAEWSVLNKIGTI